MPCFPDNCDYSDPQNYTILNNIQGPSNAPYANMGWVGFVNLRSNKLGGVNNILRVTSADINMSQEITMPNVIDGRIDKTVYQMGPRLVEGSFGLPVVADISTGGCPSVSDLSGTTGVAGSLLNNVWCWTTARGPHGRLIYDDVVLEVRYANHAAFSFDTCVVNTLSMNVAQSDLVTFDINVIGRGRSPFTDPVTDPPIRDFLSPARVLTWNDVTINGLGGCSNPDELFRSSQVREFSMEINNNADRFYTLNGSLFPMDVNVGKREITGSLTLMGYQHRLRQLAETNQDRFTEKNEIRVAFYIGNDRYTPGPAGGSFTSRDWLGSNQSPPSNAIFAKALTGVVFQIEEVSLTNDLLTTTVNWSGLANDQLGYQSLTPANCSFPAWI